MPRVGIGFAATSTLGQRRHCPQVAVVTAGKSWHVPSARATCSIECLGISISMMPAPRSGSFAQRRGTGVWASRAPSPVSGCVIHQCMESRSSVTVRRAATWVIQHAGAPPDDRCAGSIRETGAAVRCRGTAGESHGPGIGLRHRMSARAAGGVIRAGSHSRTSRVAGAHSTGRSNTQMEPSSLTVCAIMAWHCGARLICHVSQSCQ